ncbi:transglycosylase [Actinocorallia aurea]
MTVTGIISAIIFGAIIGALGRLIVPGKQNMPIWLTVLVGIVAAFAGTGLARLLNVATHGFNFWELLFQIVIAAIAVFIVSALWPKGGAGTTGTGRPGGTLR